MAKLRIVVKTKGNITELHEYFNPKKSTLNSLFSESGLIHRTFQRYETSLLKLNDFNKVKQV